MAGSTNTLIEIPLFCRIQPHEMVMQRYTSDERFSELLSSVERLLFFSWLQKQNCRHMLFSSPSPVLLGTKSQEKPENELVSRLSEWPFLEAKQTPNTITTQNLELGFFLSLVKGRRATWHFSFLNCTIISSSAEAGSVHDVIFLVRLQENLKSITLGSERVRPCDCFSTFRAASVSNKR